MIAIIYKYLFGLMRCSLPALFFLAASGSLSLAEESNAIDNSSINLMKHGEYEKALEQLKNSFNLFPYSENIKVNLAKAYAAVAKQQLEKKQFDEAADNFNNALKLFPANNEFAIMRGIALYSGKRNDEAAIVLEEVQQTIGDSVVTLFYLGKINYDKGILQAALDMWEKALAIEPDNKTIHDLLDKARRETSVESRMQKSNKSIFDISFDEGSSSDLADDVLNVLTNAYNHVGSDLSYYPTARVPVILYTGKEYRLVMESPEWSGGAYDGKVRLPIGGTKEIGPQLKAVLTHEYTHVVVGELTKNSCPVWLNEGLAEYEGRKEFDYPLSSLEAAAKSNALLSFSALEQSLLSMSSKQAALAYQQSYSMVKYMITSYGMHKVREILENLGTGIKIDKAIEKTFSDYGLDYGKLESEWGAYIRSEYGKP